MPRQIKNANEVRSQMPKRGDRVGGWLKFTPAFDMEGRGPNRNGEPGSCTYHSKNGTYAFVERDTYCALTLERSDRVPAIGEIYDAFTSLCPADIDMALIFGPNAFKSAVIGRYVLRLEQVETAQAVPEEVEGPSAEKPGSKIIVASA